MRKQDPGINQELERIDSQLAGLIVKRSRLIGRISQNRQTRDKSLADPELEKRLWKIWKKELPVHKPSLVRQVFTLLNSMGYFEAEKSRTGRPFCLYPSRRSLNLELKGPLEQKHIQCMAAMGVLGCRHVHLEDIIPNDQLLELVKLANECGGNLSWHAGSLTGKGICDQSLDGRSLFVGQSLFNFYLFFCLGLARPTRIKFSGSALLKTADLKSLQNLAPRLGARLSSIEPQSYSLPAKLEASGDLPPEIVLTRELDPEFVRALILTASNFPSPVSIVYAPETEATVQTCARVLSHCRISALWEQKEHRITIHPGSPTLESSMEVSLDPLMSGFLLAMARVGRGTVRLLGHWPQDLPQARCILNLLRRAGLEFQTGRDFIQAREKMPSQKPVFDLTHCPETVPLILAPALSREEEGPVRLVLQDTSEQLEVVMDLLSLLGYEFALDQEGLLIKNRQRIQEKSPVWTSPGPYWTLGYCLLSFRFPGICLANPDSLSPVWPGFWKIFTKLSPKKVQETDEQPQKVRKRIRVPGD